MDIPELKAFMDVEFRKDFTTTVNKEWDSLEIKQRGYAMEFTKEELQEIEQALEFERKVKELNDKNPRKTELHEKITMVLR